MLIAPSLTATSLQVLGSILEIHLGSCLWVCLAMLFIHLLHQKQKLWAYKRLFDLLLIKPLTIIFKSDCKLVYAVNSPLTPQNETGDIIF